MAAFKVVGSSRIRLIRRTKGKGMGAKGSNPVIFGPGKCLALAHEAWTNGAKFKSSSTVWL